jgi:hypothetical protein
VLVMVRSMVEQPLCLSGLESPGLVGRDTGFCWHNRENVCSVKSVDAAHAESRNRQKERHPSVER